MPENKLCKIVVELDSEERLEDIDFHWQDSDEMWSAAEFMPGCLTQKRLVYIEKVIADLVYRTRESAPQAETQMANEQEQWAWKKPDGTFRYVYPTRLAVSMCFPGDTKKEEGLGNGKLVKVLIREIEDDVTSTPSQVEDENNG